MGIFDENENMFGETSEEETADKLEKAEQQKEDEQKEMNEVFNNNPTPALNRNQLKEDLVEYSNQRAISSILGETHERATYLVDRDTLDRLDSLVAFIEATNGINSELTKGMSNQQINKGRVLTKGFRSKVINYAINQFLTEWEQNELIPDVKHVRFKIGNVYHRAYSFTENGVTYYIEHDNRGRETELLSTSESATVEEIESKINERSDLAEQQKEEKEKKKKKK